MGLTSPSWQPNKTSNNHPEKTKHNFNNNLQSHHRPQGSLDGFTKLIKQDTKETIKIIAWTTMLTLIIILVLLFQPNGPLGGGI